MDKKEQGKKNRRKGGQFELAVRKNLESKGWIVAKWTNNVEFLDTKLKKQIEKDTEEYNIPKNILSNLEKLSENKVGILIPAKRKYNPFMKALSLGTGFPDFIAFQFIESRELKFDDETSHREGLFRVLGVEAKSNGRLDKEEREKCAWLLQNNIFSKILIARRDYPEENVNLPQNKRSKKEIIYNEFKDG